MSDVNQDYLFAKPQKVAAPGSKLSLNVIDGAAKLEELRAMPMGTALPLPATDAGAGSPQQQELMEKIVAAVRTIYDPEIPVNIYDMGLIYDITLAADNAAHVKMTLTAPGCPVAGSLPPAVARKIESVPGVPKATVELVWEPAWTKARMSEAALLDLGML
jgi:FeS assembly SUF system protein